MADTLILTRPTNGVSWGITHVITAIDVTNGAIVFDFQSAKKNLVANIQVIDATGVVKSISGAIITYPNPGQVRFAAGTFTFVATDKIQLLANWTRLV